MGDLLTRQVGKEQERGAINNLKTKENSRGGGKAHRQEGSGACRDPAARQRGIANFGTGSIRWIRGGREGGVVFKKNQTWKRGCQMVFFHMDRS